MNTVSRPGSLAVRARRAGWLGIGVSALAFLLIAVESARAVEAVLPGQWHDQDKHKDLDGRGYWWLFRDSDPSLYTYDPSDHAYWDGSGTFDLYLCDPGDVRTKYLSRYGYDGDPPDPHLEDLDPLRVEAWKEWEWEDPDGNIWHAGYDASCWAATASNMLQYVTGEGPKYEEWIYEHNYTRGTWWRNWQMGGDPVAALAEEGFESVAYHRENENEHRWAADPTPGVASHLHWGLPVNLAIGNEAGPGGHLMTCYGIDTDTNKLWLAESDYSEVQGNNVEQRSYTYADGYWKIDYSDVPEVRQEIYVNHWSSFAVNQWWGDGATFLTSSEWDNPENWSRHEVPHGLLTGPGEPVEWDDTRIAKIEMTHPGTVRVSTTDAQAAKVILLSADPGCTTMKITDTGILTVGSLYNNNSVLDIEGELRANRVDAVGGTTRLENGSVRIAGRFTLGGDAYLELVDSTLQLEELYLGATGRGEFVQNGGEVRVDSVLHFGADNGSGYYTLNGGTLYLAATEIGVAGEHGIGQLHLNDGLLWLTGDDYRLGMLTIAHAPGTIFDQALHDKELDARVILVGDEGEGGLDIRDSRVSTSVYMGVGGGPDARGTVQVNSGSVLSLTALYLGGEGRGDLVQNGGKVHVDGVLHFGALGGEGYYTLNGGDLYLAATEIGDNGSGGTGQLHFNGGSLSMTGTDYRLDTLTIAHSLGSAELALNGKNLEARTIRVGDKGEGGLDISDSRVSADYLDIGTNPGALGTVRLNGGELHTTFTIVGNRGNGVFEHTAGPHTTTAFYLGYDDGTGSYTMSGTASLKTEISAIRGQFTHTSSGAHVADEMCIGRAGPEPASYTIGAGSMWVGKLHLGASEPGVAAPGGLYVEDPAVEIYVTEDLIFYRDGILSVPYGFVIPLPGTNVHNFSTDPSGLADLAHTTLIFEGGSNVIDTFEVAGQDLGPHRDGLALNFALGTLQLGGDFGIGQLLLIDQFDNQPGWEGPEVLYVKHLLLGPESYLDLGGLTLYYGELTDLGGTIDLSGGILAPYPVPEPASLLLQGLGALGVLAARRLRSRYGRASRKRGRLAIDGPLRGRM